MTNEEMQRKMEFIIEQQAQFAVNIQKLEEAQTNAEARMTRLEGAVVGVVGLIDRIIKAQERTDENVAELAKQVLALAEAQARTDQKLAETNDRLNTLITVVERFISEHRNGQAQS
jgi:ABC-type transporter Mla subunit MlaD